MAKSRSCTSTALLLVAAFVAAAVGGRLVFAGVEVLALAFTPLGVADPVVGWALVGGVLGAAVGLVVGLRRAGRKRQLTELSVGVLAVVGLALVGAGAAGDYTGTEVFPAPLFTVVVETDHLNVRPAPTTANTPITAVAAGTKLDVIGVEGGWYEVVVEDRRGRRRGWVSAAYVARQEEAPEAGPVSEGRGRSVALGPSDRVRSGSDGGVVSAQVTRGTASTAPGEPLTRVELRIREGSENVVGTWAAWRDVARASRLLAPGGASYRADTDESVGQGGSVRPGGVREGRLVFYVQAAPETVRSWRLLYAHAGTRRRPLMLSLSPRAEDRPSVPTAAPVDRRIYEAGELDAPPRPRGAAPVVNSGRAGYDGTVHLGVVVGFDGSVEDATCLDGDRVPAFVCRDAVRAAGRLRFEPGREGGRVVRSRASVAVVFRAERSASPSREVPAPAPVPEPEAPVPAGSVSLTIEGLGSRGVSCPRPRVTGINGIVTYAVSFAPDGRYVSARPLRRGGNGRLDEAVQSAVRACRAQALPDGAAEANQEARVTVRFMR